MAEVNFDAVLLSHGFIKMKPIPLEVEVLDLTSTKNRVFVSWPAIELLADGPTIEDAMHDFVESLLALCGLIFDANQRLDSDWLLGTEAQTIKRTISEYIKPVTTEGLLA